MSGPFRQVVPVDAARHPVTRIVSVGRRLRQGACWLALIFSFLPVRPEAVAAQEMAVPVEVQIPLLLKILSFDRSLGSPTGPLVIGVLYQGKYRASADAAEQVRRSARTSGREVEIVALDQDVTDDLSEAMTRHHVRVLYVSPLRAVDLKAVWELSRKLGVRTVTGVPQYVEDGLGIGIDLKGGRPEIVVNLLASRGEGADLDAQLLKLARIVE